MHTDLPDGEQHAWHEAGAIEGIVAKRQRLTDIPEEHFFVCKESAQPDGMHWHPVDERSSCTVQCDTRGIGLCTQPSGCAGSRTRGTTRCGG